MSVPITFRNFGVNEEVLAGDLNQDSDATRQLVGTALTLLTGVVNALPTSGGGYISLAIVPDLSDLTCTIGGTNQAVFLSQRIIDNCPISTFTIATNGGTGPRTDLVSVQYNQLQALPTSHLISNGLVPPTIAAGTVYSTYESINYAYSQGTSSPPVGYTAFAQITVPVGAVAVAASNIQYLFPTMQQLFDAIVGALVQSINGQSGSVMIAGDNIGIQVTTPNTDQILISNIGVTAINAQTGSVTIGPGSGVSVTQSATGIIVANTGVTSIGGQTGAISLASGAGINVSQPNTQTTVITNAGVTTLNNRTGGMVIQPGANTTITELSYGVFQIASTGPTGQQGPQGNVGPAGSQGQPGPTGLPGPSGPVGPAGPQGPSSTVPGPSGPAGVQGPIGLTGATGAASNVAGPQGPQGPQGPNGGPGSTYNTFLRVSTNTTSVAQISVVLPAGGYRLCAKYYCQFHNGTGIATLTGSGASWEGASADGTGSAQGASAQPMLYGTAIGGQQPSVTVTFSGNPLDYGGLLEIWAVRLN